MKSRRRLDAYEEMRDSVMHSGSYEEAVNIIGKYVTLIDKSLFGFSM